jgi:hypothetical protein
VQAAKQVLLALPLARVRSGRQTYDPHKACQGKAYSGSLAARFRIALGELHASTAPAPAARRLGTEQAPRLARQSEAAVK